MGRLVRQSLLVLSAVAPLVAGSAAAQPTAPEPSSLTPAAVVLFSETPQQPGTQALLTKAMEDPDPHVRRVAARVVRVTNSVKQLAALERALAVEEAGSATHIEMRSALEALNGARPSAEASIVAPLISSGSDNSKPSNAPPRVRLFPWIAPTLARDILRATGCTLRRDEPYIAAHVQYSPTGRIAKAGLEGELLSTECRRAGRVLTMLTVAGPGPIEPGVKEIVVIGFDPDWLECLEGRVTAPKRRGRPVPSVARVGAFGVAAPTKIRSVNPVYPETARVKRIEGVVILDAVITTEGCVSELAVARSVHPQLDFAALRAVMRWRYTPTILEGEPVPVFMTVTVNFTLTP